MNDIVCCILKSLDFTVAESELFLSSCADSFYLFQEHYPFSLPGKEYESSCSSDVDIQGTDGLSELVNYLIRRNVNLGNGTNIGCIGSLALSLHGYLRAPRPISSTRELSIIDEPPSPPISIFANIKKIPAQEQGTAFSEDEDEEEVDVYFLDSSQCDEMDVSDTIQKRC